MSGVDVDRTLQSIQDALWTNSLTSPGQPSLQETVHSVNVFLADPAILLVQLPHWVPRIGGQFSCEVGCKDKELRLEDTHFIALATLFYEFCKVCQWKKVVAFLPTDVSQLHAVVSLIQRSQKHKVDWHLIYFLLSWLYVLVLSPFKLQSIDTHILQALRQYAGNTSLTPIVAKITAQLFQKNEQLLLSAWQNNEVDLLTLNYYLKVPRSGSMFQDTLVEGTTHRCLTTDNEPIVVLKLLPKLFAHYYREAETNDGPLQDILNWYFDHLGSNSTEFRFQLAHSLKKIFEFIWGRFDDRQLVLDTLRELVTNIPITLQDGDINVLHTQLLIVAECSKFITDGETLEQIARDILPVTTFFQQLAPNGTIRGTQIQDASNFVIWSFARTRAPPTKFVTSCVKCLLVNTAFDRDIVIRRSSQAALQELLGRHGRSILDNATVMSLVQLPVHNLAQSYYGNIRTLYEVLPAEWFEYVFDWLLQFNLFQNLDLNVVKLTIKCVSNFINGTEVNVSTHLDRISQQHPPNQATPLNGSKMVWLLTELKLKHEMISDYVDVMWGQRPHHHSSTREEYFEFLAILRYWQHPTSILIDKFNKELFFHIVNNVSEAHEWFDEFNLSVNEVLKRLMEREMDEELYELTEKYLTYNKPLICASLPQLLRQNQFFNLFLKNESAITCPSKALLLSTLNREKDLATKFWQSPDGLGILMRGLDDYTITVQGDVGRLVRHKALEFINIYFNKLPSGYTANDELPQILLRLAIESARTVRQLAMEIILKYYVPNMSATIQDTLKLDKFKDSHNILLLLMHSELLDHTKKTSFWRSYAMYAGATRSTEEEIIQAIDEFTVWYDNMVSQESQQEVLREIVISIPTAAQITENKKLIKFAVTGLLFLQRLWSSRTACGTAYFNWKGVYAKLHNLMIVNAINGLLLQRSVIEMLPFLCVAWRNAVGKSFADLTFVNTILKRLIIFANKAAVTESSSAIQKYAVRSIAQIYIEFGAERHLEALRNSISYTGGVGKEADLLLTT
ncbi:Cin1p KNAG_0E00380 [Huiozyma naganishii CBS 8797]|uniref:Tubulin-folding cofactor D ARM repeats domain-containing protein n=1 Tax=Huiozyma naganishii (strain ATCC MYA-139 / BCRC 22969 / CBS 8797 / KCTC 17520 / NBRC 10181 / NCYC 3082 / Yp74L-3) TaxID=1071383 RepID=J7S7F6_HUIN7|nr:hypothetical protein KNAG_0E00380 [Kazachstania naganishii CBS 8797]CCK70306.1 hypothetical protein KNAG_0E00380 [Kazachstania naganishii CBS 8797]